MLLCPLGLLRVQPQSEALGGDPALRHWADTVCLAEIEERMPRGGDSLAPGL